jgi:membrane protein YqaA with SNARE-associated domain
LPAVVPVFILGGILNPWLVGLSAALGATLGELVGYGLGKGGGILLEKRNKQLLEKGEKWFKKGGVYPFIFIVLFAVTPLPDDVVGILGGMFNYNIKKFLLASFIGKSIMALALAWGGFYGISWILNIFKLGL